MDLEEERAKLQAAYLQVVDAKMKANAAAKVASDLRDTQIKLERGLLKMEREFMEALRSLQS